MLGQRLALPCSEGNAVSPGIGRVGAPACRALFDGRARIHEPPRCPSAGPGQPRRAGPAAKGRANHCPYTILPEAKRMRITDVRTAVIAGNFDWVLVRIETD